MIIPPPILAIHTWKSRRNWAAKSSEEPKRTKTIEKPITNNREWVKTFILSLVDFLSISLRFTPARWAKKAGIKGSMHGDKKVATPAKTPTAMGMASNSHFIGILLLTFVPD